MWEDTYMKNIMLMFLTAKDKPAARYRISNVEVDTRHTNESGVLELHEILKSRDEKIDKLFLFASNEVLKCTEIGGKEQTTVEFFKERVGHCVSNSEDDIVVCEYDETQSMEKALNDISRMSDMILRYKNENLNEDITIHADMTGGLRHASMMMIGVMRLLEFSQIKMGEVLYSNFDFKRKEPNYVENAKSVYRFYDLVAGAKEFINYGSVRELNEYFNVEKEKSEELIGLLTAMEGFSNSIKLCRRGEFMDAVNKLKTAIDIFESKKNKTHNDSLFATMVPVIKESYSKLFKEDALEFLDWCIQRDYLQQAMTLYTEYVPEYIFENKIAELPESELDGIDKEIADDVVTRNYYAVVKMGVDDRDLKDTTLKKAAAKVWNCFEQRGQLSEEELIEKLKDIQTELSSNDLELIINIEAFTNIVRAVKAVFKNGADLYDLAQGDSAFEKFLCVLKEKRDADNKSKAMSDFLDSIVPNGNNSKKLREFINYIKNKLDDKAKAKMFDDVLKEKKDADNKSKTMSDFLDSIEPGGKNSKKLNTIINCIKNHIDDKTKAEMFDIDIKYTTDYYIYYRGYVWSKLTEKGKIINNLENTEKMIEIINDYNTIRLIRNSVNHAHSKNYYSIEECKNIINRGVQRLNDAKEYVARKHK